MKTILTFLFAIVLCLSQAVGAPSDQSIVGKWKNDQGQLEFTADGKLVMTMSGVTANATYTLPDDGHIKMAVDSGGKKQEKTFGYTISGDTLTTDDDGHKDTMTRVK